MGKEDGERGVGDTQDRKIEKEDGFIFFTGAEGEKEERREKKKKGEKKKKKRMMKGGFYVG